MGSLAWWVGLCVVACGATACGGNEFSSDGETGGSDAGSDAGVGGVGGGGGGSGGATDAGSDAPVNKCTNELFQKTCNDQLVTTGDSDCDICGRQNCCTQTDACLANPTCAQQLKCYLESCLGQSATNCVPVACPACLGASLLFVNMSSCLQSKCTSACPMLVQ